MSILSVSIVLAFVTSTPAPLSSGNGAISSINEPEVLPDGNVRDPAPTAAALAQFVANSKRNLVPFSSATFEMGDWGPEVNEGGLPFDGPDSKPLHKVQLDAFSIGKFPVTYSEFDLFTAALRLPRINQSEFFERYRKPNNPVDVTWEGARDYCRWLGKLSGRPFDLPTEAQWEYAARSGGKRVRYPTDNGEYEPGRNLPSFDQKEDAGGLVKVDSFPPNEAGIYYMSAGVSEWIIDWYDPRYYEQSPQINPRGPQQGTVHVARGHYGDGGSEMTFKRWWKESKQMTGTWTLYNKKTGHIIREIPHTKYSQSGDSAFRCVSNK
jgi:sulfatase modifying factor 1